MTPGNVGRMRHCLLFLQIRGCIPWAARVRRLVGVQVGASTNEHSEGSGRKQSRACNTRAASATHRVTAKTGDGEC